MSTTARLGTFEDLAAGVPDDVRQIAVAARRLILEVHPGAIEVVRLGDGAATFGLGPKKMSEAHTYVAPQKKGYVNLGFFYGTSLPDPEGLLEGTGKNLRHVKLRGASDVERYRALVVAALQERKKALARG